MTRNSFLKDYNQEIVQKILNQEKNALYMHEGLIPEEIKCQVRLYLFLHVFDEVIFLHEFIGTNHC